MERRRGSERHEPAERATRPFWAEKIAIVGAGPAGAVAGLVLARAGKRVTCYDPRNVLHVTRPACNGCAGLLQESCLAALESVGLSLPKGVVQRRLHGYMVHLPYGRTVAIPVERLVAVYRGFGPLETPEGEVQGFDAWLLKKAIAAGVCFKVAAVRGIVAGVDDEARLSTTAGADSADFVIGAYGHNPGLTSGIATPEGQGLDSPTTQTSTVLEFSFGKDFCQRVYGDLVHVVILPKQLYRDMSIWFAAFVPKQEGSVTVVLMGRRDVSRQDVQAFFATAPARELLPDLPPAQARTLTTTVTSRGGCLQCKCTKNTITVSPPARFLLPSRGGIALVGDAGPTRPFKNGLGSAIDLGIQLARSIVAGRLEDYQAYAERHYPARDHEVALQLLRLHDWFLSRQPVERLLAGLTRRRIPILSCLTLNYVRHVLCADIPYAEIPPGGIRPVLRLARRASGRRPAPSPRPSAGTGAGVEAGRGC